MTEPFTIGVEEEYFLVDMQTRELRPRAGSVLDIAREDLGERVEPEINLAQVECSTPVCTSLTEIHDHLCRLRSGLMAAAEDTGSRIAALGTHPFSEWLGQQTTPRNRFHAIDAAYQQLSWEHLVCGCHVHVGFDDPDLAIEVMNRVRPWLATLRALTTNSPFWQGLDTGYASFRTGMIDRWPTAGVAPRLGSRDAYDGLVADLVATAAIPDASKLYWDVRPSLRYPTLEFRVADVCLTVDEAVMLTGLVRALVRTAAARVDEGATPPLPSRDLVKVARWRAARHGTDDTLIDVAQRRSAPAADVVAALLEVVHDDLVAHDEWEVVVPVVDKVLAQGTGSARQRAALGDGRDLRAVVDFAVAATVSHAGTGG